jgi:hypothetical protein
MIFEEWLKYIFVPFPITNSLLEIKNEVLCFTYKSTSIYRKKAVMVTGKFR